ncbi:DNA polymerase [Uliginosibacterium gangwonense]|uniref:DNA polymerase n=1 Tax=Uliginosibacterium gangwonense TaxID=392736 RepID=UPI00037BA254|nr:DNA polymerase [Uliginosibacterium gangwonense]
MKFDLNHLVTHDWETFYSTDYSLRAKKYNTSAYIRDPQFLEHCCAIKIGTKKTKCYTRSDAIKALQDIDWSNYDLLAHNNHFDGAIDAWHHGIIPRRYFCTLAQTRGLHSNMSGAALAKIAEFYGVGKKSKTYLAPTKGLRKLSPEIMRGLMDGCIIDTDLCFEIFKKQIEVFPEKEIELIDLNIRLFTQPVLALDTNRAQIALKYEEQERLRSIAYSRVDEKTLISNQKFVNALADLGVQAPTKISKYNGEITYALSESDLEFIELLDHENLSVVRLVQGRLAAKSTIIETRAARMIQAGENGQRLPVLLNYYGAATGRFSGGNKLNFQNLPRVDFDDKGNVVPMSGELRKSIIAPPGHVIVVCDSSQIEARTLNWLAGNSEKLDAFRHKRDIYSELASEIYGRQINKKTDPNERFVGKVGELGLGYGMGAPKFQTTLAIGAMGPAVQLPMALCKKAVNTYRRVNPQVPALWKLAEGILKDMCFSRRGSYMCLEWDETDVWFPNGMGLHYPGLRAKHTGDKLSGFEYTKNGAKKHIYGGLLVENIVQGLARIIVTDQMLAVQAVYNTWKLRKEEIARIASMSHDEIISVIPERLAQKALELNLKCMRVPPDWAPTLPLDAEGGFAKEYSK